MVAVIALIIIATVAFIIVRVGTTALTMTGISREAASFQAVSAFFGVGFTTSEAEMVINHPVRRRIIRDLIIAGGIGVTSTLATLMVTFFQGYNKGQMLQILGVLALVVLGFILVTKMGIVTRTIDWTIRITLEKFGRHGARDYEMLLRVQSGYCVTEQEIHPEHSLAGRPLGASRPADFGVVVLGIHHQDGSFRGTPSAGDRIEAGDVAILYGTEEAIRGLGEMSKKEAS